jgi:hypothetical protein
MMHDGLTLTIALSLSTARSHCCSAFVRPRRSYEWATGDGGKHSNQSARSEDLPRRVEGNLRFPVDFYLSWISTKFLHEIPQ